MAFFAAGLAFVGSLIQGAQQASEMRAQANVEEYRAKVATMNAENAARQASAEQERVRRESRQVLGQQRAAMAQSGTALTGSNLDIMRQSTALAELDALNVQYAGEVERRGLLNEAEMARYNAKNLRKSASTVMKTRWLTAAGAGLSAYGGAKGGYFMGTKPGKG